MRAHRRTFGSPRDTIVYRVRYSETLKPGLDADAILVEPLANGTYYENASDVVTVLDSRKCNCYFPGEYGEALYDGVTDKFIPVGSYGLLRRAKVATSPISSGGTGVANIVSLNGGVIVISLAAVKYRWADNAPSLAVGTEVWVQWLTDEQSWEIVPSGDGTGGSDSQKIVRFVSGGSACAEQTTNQYCYWLGKIQDYTDPEPDLCSPWSDGADIYLVLLGACPPSVFLKNGERYIGRKVGSFTTIEHGTRDVYAIEDSYRMVLWKFEATENETSHQWLANVTSIGDSTTVNGVTIRDPQELFTIADGDKGLCLQVTSTIFIAISAKAVGSDDTYNIQLTADMAVVSGVPQAAANYYALSDTAFTTSLGSLTAFDAALNHPRAKSGARGKAIKSGEALYIVELRQTTFLARTTLTEDLKSEDVNATIDATVTKISPPPFHQVFTVPATVKNSLNLQGIDGNVAIIQFDYELDEWYLAATTPIKQLIQFTLTEDLDGPEAAGVFSLEDPEDPNSWIQWGPGLKSEGSAVNTIVLINPQLSVAPDEYLFSGVTDDQGLALWDYEDRYVIIQIQCPPPATPPETGTTEEEAIIAAIGFGA